MSESDEKSLIDTLVDSARNVCLNAYAPYSHFRVGAAILTENGEIIVGCNVENSSYGLTICAERNAVFQMVARGHRVIKAVAIYTPTSTPSSPCGACRQVINEFGPNAVIVAVCDGPDSLKTTTSQLLPRAFGPLNMSERENDSRAEEAR